MRLNLVSFLDPRIYGGGGEMISRRLLEVGQGRGHDIRVAAVRPSVQDIHESPDLTLCIDLFNHGHSLRSLGAWRGFKQSFLEKIIRQGPFVHMANAYTDVCNLPYLPCSGQCDGECASKHKLSVLEQFILRDTGHKCFAKDPLVERLYRESALNVFLSPLHQKVCESLLGKAGLPPAFVLKPMIDSQRFFNAGLERDIDYLFVGVIGEAKGLDEMRARFRNADIRFVGRCAPGAVLDFGQHMGHVPYDEVPRIMNRAKNFVFLPRWPEPQGRVVAEAALCGCHIVGNDNVGALSFDMDLSNPQNYIGVEDEFWIKLESLI